MINFLLGSLGWVLMELVMFVNYFYKQYQFILLQHLVPIRSEKFKIQLKERNSLLKTKRMNVFVLPEGKHVFVHFIRNTYSNLY